MLVIVFDGVVVGQVWSFIAVKVYRCLYLISPSRSRRRRFGASGSHRRCRRRLIGKQVPGTRIPVTQIPGTRTPLFRL